MASSLPTEKLDRTNYASWSYKMHQYLLGHGYWSYFEGANDRTRIGTQRLPYVGKIGEQGIVLFRVLCGQTTIKLRSGCKNAKGSVGKSEEDLRREHHSQEIQLRQELSNL